MQYLRVQWSHSHPNDPVEIWSELDDEGWETRKVEIFPDGTLGYASETESAHATTLGEAPIPSLAEIAADPQFKPTQVSKKEFESIWANRFSSAPKVHSKPPAN